jgi:WD40 repeat protein
MRVLLASVVLAAVTQVAPAQPAGDDKPVVVLETGSHSAQIMQVLFTPKSKEMITVALDKTARVWDVATGTLVRTIRLPQGPGQAGELMSGALSTDGKLLALGGRGFGKVKPCIFLVDVATGRLVRTLDFPYNSVRALAISGKTLAAGSTQGPIVLYNLDTGEQEKELTGNTGGTSKIAFAPGGKRIASIGYDKVGRVWSVADGTQLAELHVGKDLHVARTIAWSPDGKWIAAGLAEDKHSGATHFGLFKPDGKLARPIYHVGKKRAQVRALTFTPDSMGIVELGAHEGRVFAMLWDPNTGEARKTYFDKDSNNEDAAYEPVIVSPDGRFVAVGRDRNHRTYLYSVGGNLLRTMPVTYKADNGRQITDIAWANKTEAQPLQVIWRTSLLNKELRDLKPTELPRNYFQHALNLEELGLRPVPPPPYRLRQEQAKGVKLSWDHAEVKVERPGKTIPALRGFGTDEDWVVQRTLTLVTPDRAVFAKRDNIHVYDTQTGKPVHSLLGPDGITRAAAVSPESKYVAAGGDDHVVRIWDPSRRAPLLSIYASGGSWIAWTPAGYYTGNNGGEKLVGWHVNNGLRKLANFYPIDRFSKQFRRPGIIALVLKTGSVDEAVKVANAAKAAQGQKVAAADIDQLLPPRVTIAIDDTKRPEVTIKVTAQAGAPGQPIKSLRLYMDGRSFPDPKTRGDFGNGQAQAQAQWKLTLPEGTHMLSARAECPDVSSFAEPVEVNGNPPVKPPTLHVLAVGINAYNDKNLTLQLAKADAEALAEHFPKFCKGPLFGQVNVTTLIDKAATKDAILTQIKAVRGRAKENDLFVFTFAGHGVKDKDQFYLLNVEANVFKLPATGLSGDELRKAVAEFPCQVLLMLDACHSAGFGAGGKLANAGLRPATDDATRTLTDDDVGVAVMCAAMAHEKAIEMKQHGLFTQAVLEALEGGPKVPRHGFNNMIYIHHLQSYVFDQVSGISDGQQHPFLNLPWIVESFPLR